MSKKVFIILTNANDNPYTPATINSHWTYNLENQFGFFDDFSFKIIRRFEQINTLPEDSIKLVLNLCALPSHPYTNLTNDVTEHINKTKNTFLWIFTPHEAKIDEISFLEFVKSFNINFDKIILTNSDDRLVRTKYLGIKSCAVPEWWEAYYRYTLNTVGNTSFISPEEKYKNLNIVEKKFLSLNRNVKIHRVWFYQALLETKTVKQGYVSYHLPTLAKEFGENLEDLIRMHLKNDPALVEKLLTSSKVFKERQLDTLDKRYVINNQDSIRDYFLKSLINFNTESHSHTNFLTEKTFKCITHSQPFIIVGGKTITKKLKERGYKTYDELFGKEVIHDFETAVRVLNRIDKMTITELKEHVNNCRSTVEHNWNHFHNREIKFQSLINDIVWMVDNG